MSSNTKLEDDRNPDTINMEADNAYGSELFPATPSQTATYIRDIVRELQLMAKRAELSFLAYLLEMATQEAENQVQKPCRRSSDG